MPVKFSKLTFCSRLFCELSKVLLLWMIKEIVWISPNLLLKNWKGYLLVSINMHIALKTRSEFSVDWVTQIHKQTGNKSNDFTLKKLYLQSIPNIMPKKKNPLTTSRHAKVRRNKLWPAVTETVPEEEKKKKTSSHNKSSFVCPLFLKIICILLWETSGSKQGLVLSYSRRKLERSRPLEECK